MSDADVHLDDIGTVFRVTAVEDGTPVDISTQTALTLTFKKPDGTTVEQTATLTGDGTDGQFEYESVSGDLDQQGTWKIQGAITLPTWIGKTAVGEFPVVENL